VPSSSWDLVFRLQSLSMPETFQFVSDILPPQAPVDSLAQTSIAIAVTFARAKLRRVLMTMNWGVITPWKVGILRDPVCWRGIIIPSRAWFFSLRFCDCPQRCKRLAGACFYIWLSLVWWFYLSRIAQTFYTKCESHVQPMHHAACCVAGRWDIFSGC
jgi:hypothetical protein